MRTLNRISVYILKRYLLLFLGLSIMAFGVAFSIKAELGTSPISSVPYVVSLFAPLTVGTATILMHCVFILLQILILRRQYHPIQLMQLPGGIFLWISDRFWRVGCAGDQRQCLLAAVDRLLHRNPAGSHGRQPGGESRRGGAGRRRRGTRYLQSISEDQIRLHEGGVRCDARRYGMRAVVCIYWAPGRRAGRHGGGGRIGGADRKADWQSTGTVESGKGVGIPYSFFRTKSYCFLCASVV